MKLLLATIGICIFSTIAIAAEDNLADAKATIERLCGEGKPGDPVYCAKWKRSYDAAVAQKKEDDAKRARGCIYKYDQPPPLPGEWVCP
jgi:hypothetical protein